MAAPPLLDVDALLAPIPGTDPAGSPSAFIEVRTRLEDMRREVLNPEDLPEDDPDRQKRADWPGVEKLASETLLNKAKDLRIVNYLVIALVRQHGFVGLREGLRLLTDLTEKCWDRLLPPIDEDNTPLDRMLPLENSLDNPEKGFRLPTALRSLPLVKNKDTKKEQPFSFLDWKETQDPQKASRPGHAEKVEAFAKEMEATSWEWIAAENTVIGECLEGQARLTKVLTERVGREAPGLLGLRAALEDCQRLARVVLEKTQPVRPAGDGKTDIPADGQSTHSNQSGAISSREDAYRQLAAAADTLERLEPHSPIPYLVRRAVELGALPFPLLIKALIRDGNVLTELNREFGLKVAEQPPPDAT